MVRAAVLFILLALAWTSPASACGLFNDEARYQIEHEMFGRIGEERLSVRCDNHRLVVERTVDIKVRVLLATIYQRQARYIEVWQDGRLIRFDGHTNDNGKTRSLSAMLTSDKALSINASSTPISAPSSAIPTDPWHHDVIHRTLLFDRHDGRLMEVDVADSGVETLTIGGHAVEAKRFVISGDRTQELWFDQASGIWLKSMIMHNSGDIIITRQTPVPTYWAAISRG